MSDSHVCKFEKRGKEMRAVCVCGWTSEWYVSYGVAPHRAVAAALYHREAERTAQPRGAASTRRRS